MDSDNGGFQIMNNINELFIESPIFDMARTNFNTVLQKLMRSIIDADTGEGTITLKVKVSMAKEAIPNYDPAIEAESRIARIPTFDHNVTSSVQVKNEIKGTQNTEMELVWDEEAGCFILKPVANTSQRSMFDDDFQEAMNTEEVVDGDGYMLPGPTKLLPDSTENVTMSEFMNNPGDGPDDYEYDDPDEV